MRRAAALAAEAQLRRVLLGAPIDSQPPAGMISDRVTLVTQREAGTGEWMGCDRVTVTASVERKRRPPIVEWACAYMVREETP
jgi:hypothetical protein